MRTFVTAFAQLLSSTDEQSAILRHGSALLTSLVERPDWLPHEYAQADHANLSQYLLYCDSTERFSVVSSVLAPRQKTPIHDHHVWHLVGVLHGQKELRPFERERHGLLRLAREGLILSAGDVCAFRPDTGDLHQVANGRDDAPSISIHVYGGNMEGIRRTAYSESGQGRPFVSEYSNDRLPNIWG